MMVRMNKTKPLQVPNSRGDFGLKIDCPFCDTLVTKCRHTGKELKFCPYLERLSYKVIGYDKTTGKRRSKNLTTREYRDALAEAAIFQQELRNKKAEDVRPEPKEVTLQEKEITHPQPEASNVRSPLLVEEMSSYLSFLEGSESVPEHKRRARSKEHCREVSKTLLEFVKCLKDTYQVKELHASDINEDMIGLYHKYILSRGLSPRSYNKRIGEMRTFCNHLIKQGKININPFVGVINRPETHNFSVLTKEEYEALLKVIGADYGKRKVGKEFKNFYREWIIPAIKIGIMSGRRVEEVVRSKWSDIETDTDGNMNCINITDYKVSRQQNRLEDNPKRIKTPVTAELKEVLDQLGYSEFKGTDNYIIGNDENMDRATMKKFLGRAFTHFWEQTEYSKTKKASFKILRKTYLSSLAASIGISNARVVSQHSDVSVLQEHYVSAQVLGMTAKNFSVFGKNEERQAELHKLRQSNHEVSLEK